MPTGVEEINWVKIARHPRLLIIYGLFVAAGWLGERLIPSECEKNGQRWEAAFYHSERRADSISGKNFELLSQHNTDNSIKNQQTQTIKTIDSLLHPLGEKAKAIIKKQDHEN